MNIRPMHHLFADDMWSIEHAQMTDEEKAILTADYTPADRHEGADVVSLRTVFYSPQGRDEQGWWVQPAEACTEIGAEPEDQTEGADMVLLAYFAVVLLALFTAWCIANYLAAANV